jgi:hypothetical protein
VRLNADVRPLGTLMSWKAKHHKIYEARVVSDALGRLAKRFDLKTLPFSDEELQTLAKRARESFRAFGSEEKKERLGKYKAHLSSLYGEACVGPVWVALEEINNEIGYEEK